MSLKTAAPPTPAPRKESWRRQSRSELAAEMVDPSNPAHLRIQRLVCWAMTRFVKSQGCCKGVALGRVKWIAPLVKADPSTCSRALARLLEQGKLWRGEDVTLGLVLAPSPLQEGALIWNALKSEWSRFRTRPRFEDTDPTPAVTHSEHATVHAKDATVHATDAAAPPSAPAPINERARAVDPPVDSKQLPTTPTPPPTPTLHPASSPPDEGVVVNPPPPPRPRSKARRHHATPAHTQAQRLLSCAEPLPTPCQVPTDQLRAALQRRGFDTALFDDLLPVLTLLLTLEHLRDLLAAFDKQAATPRGVVQPRALLLAVTRNILTQNTASTPRALCPSLRSFRANTHAFHLLPLEQTPPHAPTSHPQTHDTTPSTEPPPPQPATLRCSLEDLEPKDFDRAFALLNPLHQEMALRFAQPHLLRLTQDDNLQRDTEALERRKRYVVAAQLRGIVP